ncbi:hypothetical protein [Noviherbaspirillum saxi]|uniref:hypothetical protein n=1 Tax=Noviherbaspirillum saxi TaxID=2320863 RepID=UPI0011C34AC0|nr:hypothetical protein [Noviherbaspirillum saxi]
MEAKNWVSPLALALLVGCGGGEISLGISGGSDRFVPTFLSWTGNSSGDQVVDVNNDAFAFYSDSGCLHNFRTGRENPDFCLSSRQGNVRYGRLSMRVVNALSTAGTCITVLVEESTANFVDIELDALGREVVFVTAARPGFCA